MVEKVSEIKPNASMDIEVKPDDGALLEWIEKKKKQNERDGNTLPPATVTAQMLVQLLNRSVGGGGLKIAGDTQEKALPARDAAHHFPAGEQRLLRTAMAGQSVVQIAKEQAAVRTPAIATAPQATNDSSAASVHVGQQPAAQPRYEVKNKLPQSVSVAMASTSTTAPTLTDILSDDSEAKRLNRGSHDLQRKEEPADVKLTLQAGKTQDAVPVRQHEVSHQQSQTPVTQQQMKNLRVTQQAVDPGVKGAKNLELDYPFRSWAGEHSVKVTVPTQSLREGNITLLPSDPRAADALLRHMSQLNGLSPDLLQPGQDSDEQRQQQHAQQDEEQE
ncbi:hypothetical protein [Scandinavium sp.]|uniref:SpaN/EivJ family type III secretion system needle length determinant n=1 Tax=Scandinavium sp. TaxID=2830653 RepID=UPI0028A02302|nr:hypothetical protein [Scandinavium sp.]